MSLFKKTGELAGKVKIAHVPPFLGHSMSLALFGVSGSDSPPPFDGVAPPEARQDEAELDKETHLDREDATGSLESSFRLHRPATELLITTAGEEISIFLGSDHRHIGMCRHWPIEKQLARAQELISGILSGAVPLARSSKYPGLWIDEDRSKAEHPDADEKITFTTWNDLTSKPGGSRQRRDYDPVPCRTAGTHRA